MESQTNVLIQDQNSIHYNATQAGKPDGSRTIRKRSRKPLGDLSNTIKHQALNNPNNDFSFNERDPGAKIDDKKKKSLVKENKTVSGRKPLSNISNSAHSLVQEMSKKDLKAKVVQQEEVHLDAISEEGFLHDHGECIKAKGYPMDMDTFLQIIGLDEGFSQEPASAWSSGPNKLKGGIGHELFVLADLSEKSLPGDGYGFGQMELTPPGSPSQSLEYNWNDDENVNFELAKSPVLRNF